MTDELTPEQEAEISRLLAEARHDEPIPADVAARLDAALGDLSPADVAPGQQADVTDLDAARRRRRTAGRLILAAAAVVVGGVAIGQSIDSPGLGGDDSASSDSVDGAANAPRESKAGGDTDDSGEFGAAQPEAADAAAGYLRDELGQPLSFTSGNFAAEARTALSAPAKIRRDAALSGYDAVAPYAARELWTCPDGDYGEGARIPAYYDEQEAVLVLRRPTAGVQRVDLLRCGTAATLESVDLPAR